MTNWIVDKLFELVRSLLLKREKRKRLFMNREKWVDIDRSVCALWIVGIWHMANHSVLNNDYFMFSEITSGVLLFFMFISGYCNGRRTIRGFAEIKDFWKRRFMRFYPLFFLSCLMLYVMNKLWGAPYVVGFRQFLLSVMGLSYIILPAPSTIYFFVTLIPFYVITPLVLNTYWGERIKHIFTRYFIGYIIGLLFFVFFLVIHYSTGKECVNGAFFDFFVFYFIGLTIRKQEIKLKYNVIVHIASGILFVFLSYFEPIFLNTGLLQLVRRGQNVLFIVYIIQFGMILSRSSIINRILYPIAYSSMCMYLFHREIFYIFNRIFGTFSILFSYLVALPSVLFFSFIVQKGYDYFLKRIVLRKKKG